MKILHTNLLYAQAAGGRWEIVTIFFAIKKAQINAEDITKFLEVEIAARKTTINTKKKTIRHLQKEIQDEQQQITELEELIAKLQNQSVVKEEKQDE